MATVTKANLATYLAGLTPSVVPYPVEITETIASDWDSSLAEGTVGNIIRTSTPSGVYLDLGLTVIPYSVTNISYTFYNCSSLTTAPAIPSGVTSMGFTFSNCTSLTTSPSIPSSVIDMSATFRDCSSLTTAPIIPSSVTTMNSTFYNCSSLTTAPIIPSSVIDMTGTFSNCTSLTTAPIIPSSVTTMDYTFSGCSVLTTAPIIPSSVTTMNSTFYNCSSITTIESFSVDVDTCIMTDAFYNCPALANIYVTTLSESSWHLLHTNTGATGTDYTIYNPDGTVAGSGTVAGTSQVLTLYGKSDELVISANITPTLAVETATSQVQWHKSGLPYDDELMIFNAKNPDTVISNFITVNRAGEEFLGRSKDSYPIPTDAVLQYSFDEIKQLPDNPTGTVYKRDNDWTTVDGWTGNTGTTISVENSKLKAVAISGNQNGTSIVRSQSIHNKFICGIVTSTNKIQNIKYYDGTTFKNLLYITIDNNTAYFYGYAIAPSYNTCVLYVNHSLTTPNTVYFESLYIGDGSYLDPVIDNSYSEAHAENHGVIPVDGVCGKAGYFNNSYMIAPRPALGDDITIYFWAKLDSLTGMCIVQSRETASVTGLYVFVGTLGYGLNWGGVSAYFPSHTVPVNTWHHVTIKTNQNTRQLKINNILVASATGTYTNHTNFSTNIIIGKSAVPDGSPLTGALDGLKIVPRFTTDDEDTGEYKARANLPKFYAKSDLTSIVTLRRSANFTLPTYLDGQKIRIANTHATNTITCTLPSGQTMNGQSSFTIAPDTLLEFELIGTKWKSVSNEPELIWTNTSPSTAKTAFTSTLSGSISQFRHLEVVFRHSSIVPWLTSTGRIPIISGMVISLNSSSSGYIQRRYTTGISGVSIQWSTGEAFSGYNSGLYEETTSCVPVSIYGIK